MTDTTNKGLSPQQASTGYDLVEFGAVQATVTGKTVQVPMATIRDAAGTDAVGAPGSAIAQPTGGIGILGWLSGIYNRLGGTLTIRALSGTTDSVSVSNLPATQAVSAAALPLPNGAATETTLAAVSGKLPASLGAKSAAGSISFTPATDAGLATAAKQDTGNTAIATVNTNLGAAADAAAADDTGAYSLIALTKRLLGRITNLLSVLPASLGIKNAAGSLSVTLASDQTAVPVISATDEAKSYFTGVAVVPTTVTTGLNYFWIRNTSAAKKVKIEKIEIIMMFTGTAAASRSLYALKKFTGATATTGTVTLTPVAGQTSNPAPIAEVKWAAAGGTLTGATVGATILELGHANQLTAILAYDRDMTDAPIVLTQNEGVVLQSDGAVVAGSTVVVSVRWIEE